MCACADSAGSMAAGGDEALTLSENEGDRESQPYTKRRKTASSQCGRKFCPHCAEVVSARTFKYHKRLFYNKVGMALW